MKNKFAPWATFVMSMVVVALSYWQQGTTFRAHVEERELSVMHRIDQAESNIERLRSSSDSVHQDLAALNAHVENLRATALRIETKIDQVLR